MARVELADAVLLALIVAFEIEADGFEDQRDAGRRVFHIGRQRRRIARGSIAFVVVAEPPCLAAARLPR